MEVSSRTSRRQLAPLFIAASCLAVALAAFYLAPIVEAQSLATASFIHPRPATLIPFSFWKNAQVGGTATPSATPTTTPGSPNLITSPAMKAWYKGSDFDATTDGTEVSAWNDVSGNAFHTSALGAAGNRPVVRRNAINTSMTALESNSKRGLASGALTLSSYHNWTVFAVVKFTSEAATQSGFFTFNDGLTGNGGFDTGFGRSSGGKLRYNNYDASVILSTNTFTLNAWHYIVVTSNGGGNANVFLWIDGTSFSWAGTFPDQGANVGAIRLMEQKNTSGHFMIGQAAEYVIYNGAVGTSDRQNNLEAYARGRFGLP